MWNETAEGRAYIREVAGKAVARMTPEEADLFDTLIQDYFENPSPPDTSKAARDDALGFGLSEAMVVVTPAAAAAVSGVLSYVLAQAAKTIQEEGAAVVQERIRAYFRRIRPGTVSTSAPTSTPQAALAAQSVSAPAAVGTDTDIDFSHKELKEVCEVAAKEAQAFGMPPEQAERLAKLLVAELVLSS